MHSFRNRGLGNQPWSGSGSPASPAMFTSLVGAFCGPEIPQKSDMENDFASNPTPLVCFGRVWGAQEGASWGEGGDIPTISSTSLVHSFPPRLAWNRRKG